eukprot:2578468-Prymnesium_polylepis.1
MSDRMSEGMYAGSHACKWHSVCPGLCVRMCISPWNRGICSSVCVWHTHAARRGPRRRSVLNGCTGGEEGIVCPGLTGLGPGYQTRD